MIEYDKVHGITCSKLLLMLIMIVVVVIVVAVVVIVLVIVVAVLLLYFTVRIESQRQPYRKKRTGDVFTHVPRYSHL